MTPNKLQQICISCQECCKTLVFSISKGALTEHLAAFYRMRGSEFFEEGGVIWVMVPSVCPSLTPFGCKDYDNRPLICKRYDGRKFSFMKNKCKLYSLEEVV